MHEDRTPISEALLLNTIKLFLDSFHCLFINRLTQLETQMAKLTEVQAKQAEAISAVNAAVARVVEDNEAQNVTIQALKDQIAAGGTITEADLDSLIAGNQTMIDISNALDPIPAPVPVP